MFISALDLMSVQNGILGNWNFCSFIFLFFELLFHPFMIISLLPLGFAFLFFLWLGSYLLINLVKMNALV